MSFEGVVLSGGGTKAIIQLGVLHFYHELGLLNLEHVTEYAGTSAGAIITLLLACGFEPMEILQEVYSISNFFKSGTTAASANFFNVFRDFGLISINPAFEMLEKLIIKKIGKIPTLRELLVERGKRYCVTGVNLTKMRLEHFTPERNPNLRATDAAKISSELPFLFQRIKYKGDYYVDGGLGDNFPIEAMIQSEGKRILGVTVTGTDTAGDMTFLSFCTRVVLFPINMMTHLRSRNLGSNVTLVSINVDNVPTMEFAIPSAKKMEMFMKGYAEARREYKKEKLTVIGWVFDDTPANVAAEMFVPNISLADIPDGWNIADDDFDDISD